MATKSESDTRKKVNLNTVLAKKRKGEKLVFLTAYDYCFAKLADAAGVDMILVGDSLGMTLLGHESTLPVTMDDMIRHSQAVRRGCEYAYLVGDMPFLSYQTDDRDAVLNAGRFIAEAGCDAIKLEGGKRVASRVRAIVNAGMVVMGHLGLTPQNALQFGGWRVQGKTVESYEAILEDALALQEAGISFLLLEGVPNQVAGLISRKLTIPVYGIGAGRELDGQLLIVHDILGMYDRFTPKFVKKYCDAGKLIRDSIETYANEVRQGQFPQDEHFYEISNEQLVEIQKTASNDHAAVDQALRTVVAATGPVLVATEEAKTKQSGQILAS